MGALFCRYCSICRYERSNSDDTDMVDILVDNNYNVSLDMLEKVQEEQI